MQGGGQDFRSNRVWSETQQGLVADRYPLYTQNRPDSRWPFAGISVS